MKAPGSWAPSVDTWGPFVDRLASVDPSRALVIADRRVLSLHAPLRTALRGFQVAAVRAGESAKSLRMLERLTREHLSLRRDATVIALGGGTIGDLATVFAHVFKRGVARLIQVPTTLLAAVDSSVGGKGAVNVSGAKNVLGVFHAADEAWLCPELWTTLTEAQRREGRVEAWKMIVTLDARRWSRWKSAPPDDLALIRASRELKTRLVARDPYEQTGLRAVLNFGHTFGHVIESLSRYRVRHGEAVGLGMLHVLDLGRRLGVTPAALADELERVLPVRRDRLTPWRSKRWARRVTELLAADKKGGWILLVAPGETRFVPFADVHDA